MLGPQLVCLFRVRDHDRGRVSLGALWSRDRGHGSELVFLYFSLLDLFNHVHDRENVHVAFHFSSQATHGRVHGNENAHELYEHE